MDPIQFELSGICTPTAYLALSVRRAIHCKPARIAACN